MKRINLSKTITVLLCAALSMTTLAACQSDDTPEPTDASTAAHAPITILTGRQNYAAFDQLLKETYPEVNLEYISFHGGDTSRYMLESLKQGDIPDIYTVTYVPDPQLQKEQLLDLSNYSVVNAYATTMLDSADVDGGIYLLPSRYNLLGMVYNKSILEENGWTVPQSFEELKALAPNIQAAGYEVVNMNTALTGTTFGTIFALGNTNFFSSPEGAQWKRDYLNGNAKAVGSLEPVTDYFQQWIDAGLINTYYYEHPDASADNDFDHRGYVFQLYSNRLGANSSDEYGFMPFLSQDGSNNMLVRLVSRYYGLNKTLGQPGNEQKLEDALKVFELMATQEGQEALANGNTSFIPSTSINELPDDSMYQDVLDLINSGNMVDMVYGGWENHIVPLMERYGHDWINGQITAQEFLMGMDALNDEVLAGQGQVQLGVAQEAISLADTARLCAIAQGIAAQADVSLISLPAFHGFADGAMLENGEGVHCGIYPGAILEATVDIFAPNRGMVLRLTLTGSEIKALAEGGYLVENDPTPFAYCMVTKGDMELEDDKSYTLAIGNRELTDAALLEQSEDLGITQQQAIADYITAIETINAQSIRWE